MMDQFFGLGTAVACMASAFIFYSTGIWAERLQRVLKGWHIVFFVAGLLADTLGTVIMTELPGPGNKAESLHLITGTAAWLLMAVHAAWAIWTYFRGSEKARRHFHRFSVPVWFFWLVPCISGGML